MQFPEFLLQKIALEAGVSRIQAKAALDLFSEGATLPFVARYRKEATGGLDEISLRKIQETASRIEKVEKRRSDILSALIEMQADSKEITSLIQKASSLSELEDLWQPFKQKRKTRADKARDAGLQPLADAILNTKSQGGDPLATLLKSIPLDQKNAIKGALDILAEDFAWNNGIRDHIRNLIKNEARITVKRSKNPDPRGLTKDLVDLNLPLKHAPAHRVLALNRCVKEGLISVGLELAQNPLPRMAQILGLNQGLKYASLIEEALMDSLNRLLLPSLENEVYQQATEKAQLRAMEVFSTNLRNLLLAPPLKRIRVLGIDPGFRTGCKVVSVDEVGQFLEYKTIFPHPPQNQDKESEEILIKMIQKHKISLIAIGNGTASRETEGFISQLLQKHKELSKVKYLIVSEAGASVYSASEAAIEEFPDLDVTVRGAISIARRIQDPMAELIKIPPESIGVGMYQHDLPPKELSQILNREVESSVSFTGVDLNSASTHLLRHLGGIGPKSAQNIVDYRRQNGPFYKRQDLLKVKGIGAKAFEQIAGFCRVPESKNPLDNTTIHPESYKTTQKILDYYGITNKDFEDSRKQLIEKIRSKNQETIPENLGIHPVTGKEILKSLLNPHTDPRESLPSPVLRNEIVKIEDLKPGQELEGTVRNVVDFGLFVDLGVKVDGLVHKTRLNLPKHSDLMDHFHTNQIIGVQIEEIDLNRQRISLSLSQKPQTTMSRYL
ncbi:MAG: helix-hairpin-helix domain-containing protein [Candidatus Cloacimonetes bacterium]|nr:helix-hairpin-helix domain-containing protein [Candidatus Cloacimonadota bacterium]